MKVVRLLIFKTQKLCLPRWIVCALLLGVGACQTTPETVAGGPQSQSGAQTQPMNKGQYTLMRAGQDAELNHKYDVAANAYGRLFEKRTNDPTVLANFIRTMRYSDRAVEVVGYVESKTQHLMFDVDVKFEYGKALLAAGQHSKALAVLQEVKGQMMGDWQVDSAIGIAYDALGQFSNAIPAYTKALQMSPNNVVVMNNMAMSQAMAGHLNRAIETLENAANIKRSNVHVRQNLALLYAVKGDVDKARTLAAMDLSKADMETNLSFYRRFEGKAYE